MARNRSSRDSAKARPAAKAGPRASHGIEVVDLKRRPELAKADQILALPTLIRKIPEPMKRLIGDPSNAERALVGLDLPRAKQLGAGQVDHAK